jgi:hypothetical protein
MLKLQVLPKNKNDDVNNLTHLQLQTIKDSHSTRLDCHTTICLCIKLQAKVHVIIGL